MPVNKSSADVSTGRSEHFKPSNGSCKISPEWSKRLKSSHQHQTRGGLGESRQLTSSMPQPTCPTHLFFLSVRLTHCQDLMTTVGWPATPTPISRGHIQMCPRTFGVIHFMIPVGVSLVYDSSASSN